MSADLERDTTQGGQPSDVPGGHPARLHIITERMVVYSLELLGDYIQNGWNVVYDQKDGGWVLERKRFDEETMRQYEEVARQLLLAETDDARGVY